MTNPLRRIERAKEHLYSLEREIAAFIQAKPYRVSIKRNPKNGQPILYPYMTGRIPPICSVLVGEIVHSLRSALDNIAWSVSKVHDTSTYFPIVLEENGEFIEKLKRFREDVWLDIIEVQPYERTDSRCHPLWVLHRADVVDKHRLLLSGVTRITIATGLARPKYTYFDGFTRLNYGDVEIEVSATNDKEDDFKPEMVAQIGFDMAIKPRSELDLPRLRLEDLFGMYGFIRYDLYPRFARFLQYEFQ